MSTPDPFAATGPSDDAASTVASLAARALTAEEIALQLAMSAEAVRQHSDYLACTLSAAHDQRVERALWDRALGSVTWQDSITKLGEHVRMYRQADPDTAAAKLYLQARKPQAWGEAASEGSARVYVVALPPVARDARDWIEGIAAERGLLVGRGGGATGGGGIGE